MLRNHSRKLLFKISRNSRPKALGLARVAREVPTAFRNKRLRLTVAHASRAPHPAPRDPRPSLRIAIYAGSFDPITRGHEDLVNRSLEFVDRLVVAVATNVSKQPLFSVDERVKLIRAALNNRDRIEVRQFSGLLVDFAREVKAQLLIRGLRAVSDFEYEYQMALMNRHLSPGLETVFMVPSLDTTYISASLVREVALFGGEIGDLVHPAVAAALHEKSAARTQRG
jgi:pantetheine-phosphate adenylyltransferase